MENIATKADLATINPIDCTTVYVEENGKQYSFDYTSTAVADGDAVIDVGSFEGGHPTHAGQPFMTGRWLAQ